jgi:hypothetical protein
MLNKIMDMNMNYDKPWRREKAGLKRNMYIANLSDRKDLNFTDIR